MTKHYAIAIDGPSGAGKSTIARAMASRLAFIYIDTGAMYRAIGLRAARAHVAGDDAAGVTALLPDIRLELTFVNGEQHILLNGEDVSRDIRTEEASIYASQVSAIPAVRSFLLDFQRSFSREYNVIMDGRDIGTVVLPGADLKIFLTASSEDRARRRWLEQKERGMDVTFEEVLAAMERRDTQDSARASAPLKPAPDAVLVDTTGCTLEEAIGRISAVIQEKLHV